MEKILAYVSIIVLWESQVWGVDYCDVKFCNGSRLHTLCKYQVKVPATNCVQYERTILNDEDKNAVIDKLNKRRAMIAAGEVRSFASAANMRKLVWNDELALSAQRWADQCVKHETPDIQDVCRDLENFAVGQNIATIVGESPGLTPASLVDVWYMQLLDVNPSIITTYERPPTTIQTHQDYFTQLVWAETYQVGCGAVKFRETYDDSGMEKTRAIHRVVCNFAPKGNIIGEAVYEDGVPCSKCPDNYICDENYTTLCDMNNQNTKDKYSNNKKKPHQDASGSLPTEINDLMQDAIDYGSYPHLFQLSSLWTTSTENISRQDFLKQLLDITKKTTPAKSSEEKPCKNVLAVDDLLTLLKKKLKDDFAYSMSTTTITPEDRFGDIQVEDFISKLYKDKFTSTSRRVSEMENLNSTLLVNLVEAVIFRNTGKYTPSGSASTIENKATDMDAVKIKQIQPEFAPITASNQFDGHYFFPEDEEEGEEVGEETLTDDNNMNEKTESYYDANSNISPADVLAEIEDLKKKSEVRDFLDDILDAEDIIESSTVTTTTQVISPDDMALFKDGYNNMKRFLDEIGEKKDSKPFIKKVESPLKAL